jgi:hypothetical protein
MHIHQTDVFKAFDTGKVSEFWLEWARRHRKTTLAVNLLIREACRIPKAKYVYVSPTAVMTRNIVWDDPNMVKAYLPDKKEMSYELNEQKMLVTFENGSMIKFGGSDEPDSLRGIDAVGVVYDERSQIKENVCTEIFQPILIAPLPQHLSGKIFGNLPVFRWSMSLYTPKGVNHATVGFDKACCLDTGGKLPACGKAEKMLPGQYASRIDAELAGIMSKAALEIARQKMPKVFYEQELKCRRVTSEEMTLITSEMIQTMNETVSQISHSYEYIRRIVSIDPAFGGDICCIKGFENGKVIAEKRIVDKRNSTAIIFEAKLMARDIGTKNFIVDGINDGGIAEGLAGDDAGYYVQIFKGSHAPSENKQSDECINFVNKRAEAYYYTSEQIRNCLTGQITSIELMRQLPFATRYKLNSSGKLQIIAKDEIKEELGCSPDEADCYSMGIYGLQFVEPENNKPEADIDCGLDVARIAI